MDNDIPAGWYPDPDENGVSQRYWDGNDWTAHTHPAQPVQRPRPVPPAPVPGATNQWGQQPGQWGQQPGQWGQQQDQWGQQQGQWRQPGGGYTQPIGSGGPPPQPQGTKKWPWIVAAVVAVLVIAGIANSGSDTGDGDTVDTAAITAPSAATSPSAETEPSTPPPSARATASTPPVAISWSMPNLVGVSLQDAQDRIQALTNDQILFTSSHDASGAARSQVLDANWQVCSQNVRSGARITRETQIDFGAVKLGESCP